VLAHVAEKLEVSDLPHPVGVVHHVDALAGRLEHPANLPFHPGDVGGEFLHGEQVPLLAAAAGVADHAGGAADEGHRLVAGGRHAAEQHQRHEVPDVEAVGRGVEACVDAAAGRAEP
jgi:hypothetical protein